MQRVTARPARCLSERGVLKKHRGLGKSGGCSGSLRVLRFRLLIGKSRTIVKNGMRGGRGGSLARRRE